MEISLLINQLLSAITQAAVLSVIASGLTLVFGSIKVINFAHGSLYMLGAYLCYTLVSLFAATGGTSFWLALILVPIALALVGGIIEVLLLRRIYLEEHALQLLLTFGLVYVLGDVVKIFWGTDVKSVSRPDFLAGVIQFSGAYLPLYNLLLILLAVVVFLGLWIVLYKTKVGWLIRASSADPETANALGVNVPLLFTLVFMLGAFLDGLGGAAAAPISAAALGMDVEIIILCFIVVIIGGPGSLLGAIVAALLIGVVDSFGILILPEFTMAFTYVLMAVVMILRPSGLFGQPV
jgi:branched-subunit amino acid ABC-type transport system permease component